MYHVTLKTVSFGPLFFFLQGVEQENPSLSAVLKCDSVTEFGNSGKQVLKCTLAYVVEVFLIWSAKEEKILES